MNPDTHDLGRRRGAPLFYAGWAGFALFGTVVYLDGHAGLSYAAIHVLVAVAMCTWHVLTAGRAAPVVGAVLGTLFGVQMTFFVISGNFMSTEPLKVRVEDAFGLLAAVLIVTGAILGLRGRPKESRADSAVVSERRAVR